MRLAYSLVLALVLAGCTDDHGHTYDCGDGSLVDTEVAGHHDDGFDGQSLCAMPEPLTIVLSGLPESVTVFERASFDWSLDAQGRDAAHSMLTSVRASDASVLVNESNGPEAYGVEVDKCEHQDLPWSCTGELYFEKPGTVHVRAYAEVLFKKGAETMKEHVWTEEVIVNVLPVQATGVVHNLTHAVGPVDPLSPVDVKMNLGDSLVFVNQDVSPHEFTLDGLPCMGVAVNVPAQSVSQPFIPGRPGSCTVSTDDVQPKAASIQIAPPG